MPMEQVIPAWMYTRLMAHECLIEVMLANNLALIPKERSEAFKSDLAEKPMRLPPRSGPIDVQELQALEAAMKADVQDILRKISEREANIRDLMARGQ